MGASGSDLPQHGFELFDDPEVLAVLAHPTRQRIYVAAVTAPVSAKELSDEFEQPLPRISYHVRILADAGLLKAVRQTPRRGALETHYRAIATLDLSDELIDRAPPEVLRFFTKAAIRELADDALHSVDAEHAAEARDFMLTRSHFVLDAGGRARLFAELRDFHRRLQALDEDLGLQPGDEGGTELNVTLTFYPGERRAGRNHQMVIGPTPEGEENLETVPRRTPPPA